MAGVFVAILKRLGGHASFDKPDSGDFEPTVIGHDDEEMCSVGAGIPEENASILGVTIGIIYVDGKRQKTRRRIECRGFVSFLSGTCLRAYCHERDAERTFRIDRIKEVIDLATGQVFDDPVAFLQNFTEWGDIPLEGRAKEYGTIDPHGSFRLCADGIRLLVFLARCDGHYQLEEREAIAAYIDERCGDLPHDLKKMLEYADHQYPTEELFFETLDRLSGGGTQHMRLLLRKAIRLIEADGKITEEEFNFAEELQLALEDMEDDD